MKYRPIYEKQTLANKQSAMQEARKKMRKSERIDYARRLERVESLKAEKRMKAGKSGDPTKKSSEGETSQIVAQKLGIGSKDTYRKEKFITENRKNLTPEDFADWDEGKLSTNKAFKMLKPEYRFAEFFKTDRTY